MMSINYTNLNLNRQLAFATIAGSSLIAVVNYDLNDCNLPSVVANYEKVSTCYSWEDQINASINSLSDTQYYSTILSFAHKLVSESKDIDIEIQSVVNNIFWDLL